MLVGKRVGEKRKMKILKGVTGALKPVHLMRHIASASRNPDLSLSRACMPGLYTYILLFPFIIAQISMLLYMNTLVGPLIVHSVVMCACQALLASCGE